MLLHKQQSSSIKDLKSIEQQRKELTVRGLAGLTNLGNTCYMNTIIQCLSSLNIFRSWLMSKKFLKRLQEKTLNEITQKKMTDQNLQNPNDIKITKIELDKELEKECNKTIICALTEVMARLWNANDTVTPQTLKSVIGNYSAVFRGYNQNDAHELLILILEKIHEETKAQVHLIYKNIPDDMKNFIELKKNYRKINPISQDHTKIKTELLKYKEQHSNSHVMYKAYTYWKDYIKNSQSIITDIFTGLYYSHIKCDKCNNTKNVFEPFTVLSLQIKEHECTLDECLTDFTQSETLTEDNQYQCGKCNMKCEATKRIKIWEAPPILIIHLKRFKMSKTNIMSKITTKVTFPITDFNIKNYMSPLHKLTETTYNLCAMSEHKGTYHQGHYKAFCKNGINNRWYEFNDSHIHHIPQDKLDSELVNNNAYILFYIRTDVYK